MKRIYFLSLFLFINAAVNSQTKKVFLEEFTSSFCCYSVNASLNIDSLLNKYPELISVSCHAGFYRDSMWFEEIDTLSEGFSISAVPLGAIDRIYYSTDTLFGTWQGIGQLSSVWDTLIEQRLNIPANLTVSFDSVSWDSITRDISAHIEVNIVTNLPEDDYRIGLYIVEDSVIGYQTDSLCNDLYNYYHRRVARALLPSTWSPQGILPALLYSGQSFTSTIDYNLPDSINENQVSLIAFVYRYSSNHQNDEVLNVEEAPLIFSPISNIDNSYKNYETSIFPNPTSGKISIKGNDIDRIEVINIGGNKVFASKQTEIDLSDFPKGIYIIKIFSDFQITTNKLILE
jgi:hypothetical protein